MAAQEQQSFEKQAVLGQRVDALLDAIWVKRPGVKEWFDTHQHMTLAEYAQSLLVNTATPLQPRQDVAEVIREVATPTLGVEKAQALGQQVLDMPVIISANHHGPDFIGLTRQGVGILALALPHDKSVIVTACGAVPQNNLAYARGISLARFYTKEVIDKDGKPTIQEIPYRINITPDSQRDTLVSASGPMTAAMITGEGKKGRGALAQVRELHAAGTISTEEAQALERLLQKDYLSDEVLRQPTLSAQSTVLNAHVWREEFAPELQREIPDAAYLELEQITGRLLVRDLSNPNSLAYTILFDPQMRSAVVNTLDGVNSCWNTAHLQQLSSGEPMTSQQRLEAMRGAGSMFFLGVDEKGSRVPLILVGERVVNDHGRRVTEQVALENVEPEMPLFLRGVDKSGKGDTLSFEFTPEALQQALREGRILPSVFSDFVEILSRGLRAHGGFNQGDYFPLIKAGIVHALETTGRAQAAGIINTVQTDNLTAGLKFAVAHYPNGIKGAGGVELLARPITAADYERIRHLTVRDAFLIGAPEMYKTVYGEKERDPQMLSVTEADILEYVGDKYVARQF